MADYSKPEAIAASVLSRIHAVTDRSTPGLRKVRRDFTRILKDVPGLRVLRAAEHLLQPKAGCPRWIAYELVYHHADALSRVSAGWAARFGKDLSTWGDVDAFACYILGPAWRERQIPDADITRWAGSRDRWKRRAALVATVPLNSSARGGRGDAKRTLAVCDLLMDDRDDMVVKALSWALRELATKDSHTVETYLRRHDARLAARVKREVANKLTTGLKDPRRSASGTRGRKTDR